MFHFQASTQRHFPDSLFGQGCSIGNATSRLGTQEDTGQSSVGRRCDATNSNGGEEAKRNGYAIDSQSKNNWMENQSFPRESFNSLSRVQSKCSVLQSSPDATNFELPSPREFLFTWIGSDESVIELPLGHIIVQCLKEYDEQGGKESRQHRIEHNVE